MSTPPTTTLTLTALGVLGFLEWPVALVLGAGHVLAADRSDPAVRQAGQALGEA